MTHERTQGRARRGGSRDDRGSAASDRAIDLDKRARISALYAMDETTAPMDQGLDGLGAPRHHPLRTLPEQIADDLGGRILRGAIKRGTRLREVQIAASYGVSRAPIREAIRLLERKGLADFTPRRGAFVTEMTVERFIDIFNVMVMLLGLAARGFAERHSPEGLAELRSESQALVDMAADPGCEARAFSFAAWRMSEKLARHCGSEATADLLSHQLQDTAWGTMWRHLDLDYAMPERRQAVAKAYWERYEAIAAGDGDRAERITIATGLSVRDHAASVLAEARGDTFDRSRLDVYRLPN